MKLKFKDFEYKRPDFGHLKKQFETYLSEFSKATSAGEQYNVLKKINRLRKDFDSMDTISYLRYLIKTNDKFYSDERDFFGNINPGFSGLMHKLRNALLKSEFRNELEVKCGKYLFTLAEVNTKTFSPEITDDLKTENYLVSEYIKLAASANIHFEGAERNVAGMAPFMQSDKREIRKSACEAMWKFFEDNEKEYDRIYDELVKVRTRIAKKLGYENFIQLGYDRLNRTGYTCIEVSKFRNSVKDLVVPSLIRLDDIKKKILRLDKLYYYDSGIDFIEGNAVPKGSGEWIVHKAKKMFEELSDETSKFINFMIDDELMDLHNRKGRAGGGYSTFIPIYKAPFIFMNMNGTSHDVKILIHEAGHAFQAFESRDFEMIEYMLPTMDVSEIHSMSMEFITLPWMKLFFEEDTEKFFYSQLSEALRFIQYGTIVDEFQHFVYANPEISPDERKKAWRDIEMKYNPSLDYGSNGFLERGCYWLRNGLIFKEPFYYVDYCLAEICALQFWRKFNYDRDTAWDDYMRLCKAGGSKPFLELLKTANIESPFNQKVIESVVRYCEDRIENTYKNLVMI
jgi:M3 family oligoendopeptidase